MDLINAICPNCKSEVGANLDKEANVCPNCGEAFVTEKALTLYNLQRADNLENSQHEQNLKKQRHRKESIIKALKMIGKTFLFVLECIGYLLYVICFIWLFVDLTDGIKKK